MQNCTHLNQINIKETNETTCPACVELGDTWVHLRMCLVCGNVGCCDDSKNTHATRHFKETSHPVMRSIENGDTWIWCYEDEAVVGEI